MGNGQGITIQNIGESFFSSPFHSKLLALKSLLRVPMLKKNLSSVSKFAKNNNVYFEFFPNSYFVKDQVTQVILMKRTLKNGLYAFDLAFIDLNSSQNSHPTSCIVPSANLAFVSLYVA